MYIIYFIIRNFCEKKFSQMRIKFQKLNSRKNNLCGSFVKINSREKSELFSQFAKFKINCFIHTFFSKFSSS